MNNGKTEKLFATLIYRGTFSDGKSLNKRLLKDVDAFAAKDKLGKDWSKENYPGGYTSYASLSDLQYRSPAFAELSELLQPHAEKFAKEQEWLLKDCRLEMTSCWMNVMPKGAHHSLHLHPHSVISGTYYVSVPKGSSALKLEDPRMGFYMNAPVWRSSMYYELRPEAGSFVFFESWLRHEVPANQSKEPRVSISFNYEIKDLE